MLKRVYIETTIPSFYYETRGEPDMVARRSWTRSWWDLQRINYEVLTSIAVTEELENGDYLSKESAIQLISGITFLPIVEEVEEIVNTYINRYVMPRNPRGDALHLALASYYRCHFLLTWNCDHLANANKFEHIRHINTILGLSIPMLVTPLELLNKEETADERPSD
jgi:hypothetical protein